MVILKYELKRHRTYILGWTIALAVCIFLMTPTYYSFLDVASVELFETMGTTDFYRSVGVSMEYLTSPLGIYGFLTSFFMIASGVFGRNFGIPVYKALSSENNLLGKGIDCIDRSGGRRCCVSAGFFFGHGNVSFRNSMGRVFSDCSVPHPCYAVLCCNGSDGGNFVSPQP